MTASNSRTKRNLADPERFDFMETNRIDRKSNTPIEEIDKLATGFDCWAVLSGQEAVIETERRICGRLAVTHSAQAEGTALADIRSAALLFSNLAGSATSSPLRLQAPVVVHTETGKNRDRWFDGPVVLLAADHQQAVDHCLLAHCIAQELNLPVLCLLDSTLQEQLARVQIPDQAAIDSILAHRPKSQQPASTDLIQECLSRVERFTGRQLSVMRAQSDFEGRKWLVTVGAWREPVSRFVEKYSTCNALAGWAELNLLRPFPAAELEEMLAGSRECLFLIPPDLGFKQEILADLAEMEHRIHGTKFETLFLPAGAPATVDLEAALEPYFPNLRKPPAIHGPGDKVPAPIPFRIGVTPAGHWTRTLLFEAAARLGSEDGDHYRYHSNPALAFLEIGEGNREKTDDSIELLILFENSFLDPEITVNLIRPQGTLLIAGPPADPVASWQLLPERTRSLIIDRRLQLWWLPFPSNADASSSPSSRHAWMIGALYHAMEELDLTTPGLRERYRKLVGGPRSQETVAVLEPAFQQGYDSLIRLDPETLNATVQEVRFRKESLQPHMPEPIEDSTRSLQWKERIRDFHLRGPQSSYAGEALPDLPLWPAVMSSMQDIEGFRPRFPLYVGTADQEREPGILPLTELLRQLMKAAENGGKSFHILKERLQSVVQIAAQEMESRPGAFDFPDIMESTLSRCRMVFDVSSTGTLRLDEELKLLADILPDSGLLVAFRPESFVWLYSRTLAAGRIPARLEFQQEVRRLMQELDALLLVEQSHSEAATSPEALTSAVGGAAQSRIDTQALSRLIPRSRGPRPLEAGRRARIEQMRAILQNYLQETSGEPAFYLLYSGSAPEIPAPLPQPRLIRHSDCLSAAAGLFDGIMSRMVKVFRAVRGARLEVENSYDPEQHDAILERFEWQSCSARELLATVPVVVLESVQHVTRNSLSAFSRLLLSNRPVTVLITESDLPEWNPSFEGGQLSMLSDVGTVAVAHRETVVAQTSLATTDHLMECFKTISRSVDPAVAVISVPRSSGRSDWDWLCSGAAHAGRAHVSFLYDPEAGESWAEKLVLAGNPQPEKSWPEFALHFISEGAAQERQCEFTFIHAAALLPWFRSHFRLLPVEAWNDEQMELSDYLKAYTETPPAAVPYIWVVSESCQMQRAVLTRELVALCRDRKRSWRMIQELAGLNNEYVRLARQEAREEATREIQNQGQNALDQAREEGARAAVERLVAVLTNPDAAPSLSFPSTREPTAEETHGAAPAEEDVDVDPSAQPASADTGEEQDRQILISEEPYIDSALCTSCNDCIKLNPLLFQYDENKQAYIADPEAGTFAELVKAAEQCPAHCIHPGSPRAGDETATEEMIERARALEA